MSIRIISSGSIEGATRLAIVRLQTRSNLRKVDEPVDPAKQVIVGDMPLKAEAVEQRLLHHPPLAHHRPNLPRPSRRNQRTASRSSGVFQRNPSTPAVHCTFGPIVPDCDVGLSEGIHGSAGGTLDPHPAKHQSPPRFGRTSWWS